MISKKALRRWFVERSEDTTLQVPRALAASVLTTTLDFWVLVGLVELLGWNPLAAAALSYLLGGVLMYVLSAVWIFPGAPRSATLGFAAFTVLSLVGLGVTWLTMAVLVDLAHVNYALAKIASLGPSFAWNFLSRKYWLFKPSAGREPARAEVPAYREPEAVFGWAGARGASNEAVL